MWLTNTISLLNVKVLNPSCVSRGPALNYLCAECVLCKFGEYDVAANREMGDLMECLIMSIYPDYGVITWPGRIIQSHTSSLVVCHGIAVRIYFGMLCKCCRPEYDINCGWAQFRHDDVIKWKHFPRYWPFVRGIHRRPVNSHRNGQWRGALMFSWSAPK